MSEVSLEHIIKQHVPFSSRASIKGWWVCKCAVCNDYKKRGGFKFEGDVSSYHCFNCNHVAKHDPTEYASISDNMQIVLDDFGVPEEDYKQIVFNALHLLKDGVKREQVVSDPDTKLVTVPLPEQFILLEDATDTWATIAKEYIEFERGLDPTKYPYYILEPKKQDKFFEKKWRGRLIIPYFRSKQVVWYQGRDMRPNSKMRYLNAETESECILSEYDKLFNHSDEPLYVLEGFFDAVWVDGVAVFGNTLKAGQIKLLNKSPRRKVYIPDMKGNGHLGALQAIHLGWNVSVPEIGSSKDLNEAMIKYGKLYVMKSIDEFTLSGYRAEIRVRALCEH